MGKFGILSLTTPVGRSLRFILYMVSAYCITPTICFAWMCKSITRLLCKIYNWRPVDLYGARLYGSGCSYNEKIVITLLYSIVNIKTIRMRSIDNNICRLEGENMYGPDEDGYFPSSTSRSREPATRTLRPSPPET
jgi:hypothetical protein